MENNSRFMDYANDVDYFEMNDAIEMEYLLLLKGEN